MAALLRVVAPLVALLGSLASAFEVPTYDRALVDAYNDISVWDKATEKHVELSLPDGSGSPDHVRIIDADFYDRHLVSRWTSGWLGGDTTWVVGVTRKVPFMEDYRFGLVSRTIRVLNDHYYQGNEKVRFALLDYEEDELIKESLGGFGPHILVLQDGKAHIDAPFRDSYHKALEFLEKRLPEGDVAYTGSISGRFTVVDLYIAYWKRALRQNQKPIARMIKDKLIEMEAPQWAMEIAVQYGALPIDVQIMVNAGVIFYLLGITGVFTWYVLCCKCRGARPQVEPSDKKTQ